MLIVTPPLPHKVPIRVSECKLTIKYIFLPSLNPCHLFTSTAILNFKCMQEKGILNKIIPHHLKGTKINFTKCRHDNKVVFYRYNIKQFKCHHTCQCIWPSHKPRTGLIICISDCKGYIWYMYMLFNNNWYFQLN